MPYQINEQLTMLGIASRHQVDTQRFLTVDIACSKVVLI
jgi:hypothetical protein